MRDRDQSATNAVPGKPPSHPRCENVCGRSTVAEGLTRRLPRAVPPRIGLRLDTSDQTPEETVTEILARAWTDGQIG
ncbi:hypothetical protein [Micromonospora tulbaghiae]|uniref:hypothetical protein n=1 Tax=Micromonospora tulbaghiae TaxID=479978 RepID=UPI0036A5C8CE